MKVQPYYYRCSPSYIDSIAADLRMQIVETIEVMPRRNSTAEINFDLFWLLTSMGWSYNATPDGIDDQPDACLGLDCQLEDIAPKNERSLCRVSETFGVPWYVDFGKQFDAGIVQLGAQFGGMEAMLKDYCGFKIAAAEKRLALGIVLVLMNPDRCLAQGHAPGYIATFETARDALNAIGIDCPIWLIGIQF